MHCRCSDCHGLTEKNLKGFTRGSASLTDFLLKQQLHNKQIEGWRHCERYWEELGTTSPDEVNVIECDDTSAVYFPHFTQRPFKESATLQGVGFVPWMVEDLSRGRRTYVYSRKGRWTKGQNRYCTQMLRVIQGYEQFSCFYITSCIMSSFVG
jgi:hypothetical protein